MATQSHGTAPTEGTPDASTDCAQPEIEPGLVEALTAAYAELIKRQRTASAAFVRWTAQHRRAHEFCWLENRPEVVMSSAKEVRVTSQDPLYESIQKMMATIELNPYERELLYGYPYVIGRVEGTSIRAPLLSIPIVIRPEGATLVIKPNEEILRFNSLPFRSDLDSAAHEQALDRLIDATPRFPLSPTDLRYFCEMVMREMRVSILANLNSHLAAAPVQPRSAVPLTIVDSAAVFIAPKTSYFLASDLEHISKAGAASTGKTALGWLVGRRGHEPTSNIFDDSRKVFFPFPSNPSQRRVALLANVPDNRIIVVQGPPGTGKSLTIANVACHLVAQGKRVLICSQKDKALEVVDGLLRGLNLAQLPMTLLRQDSDSRRELRDRLDSIQKDRSVEDTRKEAEFESELHGKIVGEANTKEQQLASALIAEHSVATADEVLKNAATLLRRIGGRWRLARALRVAQKKAPNRTDALGQATTGLRAELLGAAVRVLSASAKHRTGKATKVERNQLREFSKLLARNQTNAQNFSIFDRLKKEPAKCEMLLKILPCWIMSPDDVARLFPCEPGLFDVVIVDEASQCDLPSMTPALYRAKQAIVAGDSKQMQAQRFAFTSAQVASEAWRKHGLDRLDPDRWLDPARRDLLELASVRFDEEAFLDEHYRSLPPIIAFSNHRWYNDRLRLMRDTQDRRVGDPETSAIVLHRVTDGHVKPGTQENDREAEALVSALKDKLEHPGYASASFGVICLFEEQMHLVNDLVAEQIDEELRARHDLVVVNPDGFQGDERDVIFYSLSYDADGMERSSLSARQADRGHIQGMLNVAFTRAREEIHVFHSAEIEEFGTASGSGTILDWLKHCASSCRSGASSAEADVARADSGFEADVIRALGERGVKTISQYPSCGFFIDVVAEMDGRRLAIECDGEIWHLDEHGELKLEDVWRQEILERAGWEVLRIPYRSWRKDPATQIACIVETLSRAEQEEESDVPEKAATPNESRGTQARSIRMNTYEAAVYQALNGGEREYEDVLKSSRINLGLARLGPRIRESLDEAVRSLVAQKIVSNEDRELFVTREAQGAIISVYNENRPTYKRRRRRWTR